VDRRPLGIAALLARRQLEPATWGFLGPRVGKPNARRRVLVLHDSECCTTPAFGLG
jgi:hypothetical protein